jgi:RHS repeat-associated protein
MSRNITLSILFLFVVALGLKAQSIQGPSSVQAGTTNTYTLYNDVVYASPNWATDNGTIVSETHSGLNHSADIKFDCPGSANVYFRSGTTVKMTYSVTVTAPTKFMTVPSTSFSYASQCGSTVITRTSNPGAQVEWYWQTSATGTSTALGNGTTLTVTSSGTYYLRSRSVAAPCYWVPGALATASVTVNQIPVVTTTPSPGPTICSGQSPSIALNSTVAGTTFSWTVSSAMNVTGASAGSGNTINQTLTNGDNNNLGIVLYTVTPVANGCTGSSIDVRVNVLPLPAINSSTISICSGTALNFTPTFSNSVTGTYSWTSSVSGTVSGITASGNNVKISDTPINTSTSNATVTYTITPLAGGCTGAPATYVVTVKPNPQNFTASGTGAYCTSGTGLPVALSGSQSSFYYQLKKNGANSGTAIAGTGSALSWANQTAGTYTVAAQYSDGTCAITMPGSAVITADAVTVGGTVSSAEVYGTGNVTLTLSGQTGSVVRWEQYNGSTWTTITNTATSYTYNYTTTGAKQLRAVVKSGTCAQVNSNAGTVTTYATPALSLTGSNTLSYGDTTLVKTTPATYNTYQWIRNGVDIAGATQATYVANEPGTYTLRVKGSATAPTYTTPTGVAVYGSLLQQPGRVNFVSVTRILKPGVTTSTSLYSLSPQDVAQSVVYTDGLGRVFQSIAVGQSPEGGDIVSPAAYGKNGLTDTTYLPYTTLNRDGRVRGKAVRTQDQYLNSEQYQFYQTKSLVEHDTYPYAVKRRRSTPDARVIEQGTPGADWQIGAHTVKSLLTLNSTTYPVRYWKPDGTTVGNYAANTVSVAITTDENGNKVRTFTDNRGLTVLKQVQLDETINGTLTSWLDTYYIFDDFGRLIYQLPPKAMNVLGTAASLNANNTAVAELIYTYKYDTRGRVIEKKVPGAAVQYMVYDKLDRMVLSQDGNLRSQGKWGFTKYDQLNRIVYSGVYASASDRPTLQSQVDALDYNTVLWYESEAANATYHGYTNVAFPTTNTTVLAVNYYDHYDFDRNGTADYSYDNTHLAGIPSSAVSPRNLSTGNKQFTIDASGAITTSALINVMFYDEYDRAIQTLSNNHLNLSLQDKVSVLYDFSGKVLKSKTTHVTPAGTVTLNDRSDYDHAGRVTALYRQVNTDAEVKVTQYQYNALGQLVDKKLHVNGASCLQSVDYRYNIRGSLRAINNATLTSDGILNDDTNDLFGMELVYNVADASLGNTAYYNGNISAIKWKGVGATAGTSEQRSYKYTYDKSDKLKLASFQAHNGTNWGAEANTLNESMTYDHNGNVLTLQRNKNARSLSGVTVVNTATAMDNLTYTYASGNQLSKVEDSSGDVLGFKNGATATSEYTYTSDGSLSTDSNKGISNITYNILGKPAQVTMSDGTTLQYTYAVSGEKLRFVITKGSATTTDYVDAFVYTNNSLSFFGSPEGRIVKNGSVFTYEYGIMDHQGNTRVVVSSATAAPTSLIATFEGDTNDQSTQFQNVNATYVVSSVSGNHTAGGSVVVRMNQAYKVGPAKSMMVYPGDKVDIEVWEYHENNAGWGTTATTSSALVNLISSAFGGVSGGTGESGMIFSGVQSAVTGFVPGGNRGDASPAAYLNYILFDKNYKVLNMGSQVAPATTFTKQKIAFPTLNIKEAGYIFVYLSYDDDSNNWVQFDDFKITYTPTNVVQYNEYYPYGIQGANSWTRSGSSNNFLYNSATELNSASGLYDLAYRNYDPALGRFHQVDPFADNYSSHTPYNFANNDPVSTNDALGLWPLTYTDPYMQDALFPRDRLRERGTYFPPTNSTLSIYRSPGESLTDWSYLDNVGYGYNSGGYGSSGSITIGNLVIDMDALPSGVHSFTMENGMVTSYNDHGGSVEEFYASFGGSVSIAAGGYSGGARLWGDAEGTIFSTDGSRVTIPGRKGGGESLWETAKRAGPLVLDAIQNGFDVAGLVPGAGEAFDALNAGIYTLRGDYGNAALSAAGAIPFAGWGATGTKLARKVVQKSSKFDNLNKAAGLLYPKKAGKVELHHITPQYLGGPKNGVLMPLDGAYHQQITNEFRKLMPYPASSISPAEVNKVMNQVYAKYPLFLPL